MRNMLSAAPHQQRQLIASLIRTIFVQPDHDSAVAQLRAVVHQLEPSAPGVARRLTDMEADLLAYTGFPPAHWSKIWSNNPIERLNRERNDAPTSSGSSPTPHRSSASSAPSSSRSTTK